MKHSSICYLLLAVLLITLPTASFGQAMIALLFGGKIKNDKIALGLYLAEQSSYLTNTPGRNAYGLAIGAYSNFKLSEKWELSNYITCKAPKGGVKIPLGYQLVANAVYPEESTIKRKIVYFEIIPLIRYHITPSLGIGVGPQFGFRTVSKDSYINKRDDGSTETIVYKTKDYLHRLDAGLSADLQYALMKGKGIRFNLRFTPGLTNINQDDVEFKAHNGYFQLGFGIPIGGNKK